MEAQGINIHNICQDCESFDERCKACEQEDFERTAIKAYNKVEEGLLEEGDNFHKEDDNPPSSDWVNSVTYRGIAKKVVKMIEIWDDKCHLVELSVKFVDPSEDYDLRHEFLPPIVQLQDGGVYEELWELDDETQRARERECKWCHLLTPKQFSICTSCDNPQE